MFKLRNPGNEAGMTAMEKCLTRNNGKTVKIRIAV